MTKLQDLRTAVFLIERGDAPKNRGQVHQATAAVRRICLKMIRHAKARDVALKRRQHVRGETQLARDTRPQARGPIPDALHVDVRGRSDRQRQAVQQAHVRTGLPTYRPPRPASLTNLSAKKRRPEVDVIKKEQQSRQANLISTNTAISNNLIVRNIGNNLQTLPKETIQRASFFPGTSSCSQRCASFIPCSSSLLSADVSFSNLQGPPLLYAHRPFLGIYLSATDPATFCNSDVVVRSQDVTLEKTFGLLEGTAFTLRIYLFFPQNGKR